MTALAPHGATTIHRHPHGFDTGQKRLKDIHAANAEFLSAFVRFAVGLPLTEFAPALLPIAEASTRQIAASEQPILIKGMGVRVEVEERILNFRAMRWLANSVSCG